MNILRKITIITVIVIVASVSLLSYIDYFEKNQNRLVDNNPFVKDCIPKNNDEYIPSIGIENSTHTFDLRSCTWIKYNEIPSHGQGVRDFDDYKEMPICQSTREACQIPPTCINKYFECDVVSQEIFEDDFEIDYTEKFD